MKKFKILFTQQITESLIIYYIHAIEMYLLLNLFYEIKPFVFHAHLNGGR